MTLKEWCERTGVTPTHPTPERGAVSLCYTYTLTNDDEFDNAWALYHLEDYAVSSHNGPVIWLVPRSARSAALFEVPNLDNLTTDSDQYRLLARVFQLLSNYARNKAEAMEFREGGYVELARQHEEICQTEYERLPPGYRW